jgi:hypothetical protein
MTLTSALEDLQETTLEAISGILRRLEYLARLKDRGGDYVHWGFVRVHGDLSAKKALAQSHRSLVSEVLSTPIRNLLQDVEKSSALAEMPPVSYVERLCDAGPQLLPAAPAAGSSRHLSSVLHALLCLSRVQRQGATPPASWPPQPPGR